MFNNNFRGLLNFKTIQSKMILVFLIFLVLPMSLLSLITFRNTETVIRKKVEELTFNTLEQLNSNFQKIIDNMVVITNVIEMDRDFLKTLDSNHFRNDYEYYLNQKKINDKLTSSLGIILRYNCQIAFIKHDGPMYYTWNSPVTTEKIEKLRSSVWFQEAVKGNGNYFWIAPQQNYIPEEENSGRDLITLAKLIKGETRIHGYGVLVVSLYIDELEKGINGTLLPDTAGFFIINGTGEIVLKTPSTGNQNIDNFQWCSERLEKDQGQFTVKYQGEKLQVFFKKLKNVGWKAIYVTTYSNMLREVRTIEKRDLVLTLLIMIMFTLATVFIVLTITKPIKLLHRKMNAVKNGDLDTKIDVASRDEVGQLTENFNLMIHDLKMLLQKNAVNEREKKEAHLTALQAQINPHFLFNTLNAIKWTAYVNGVNHIGDLIASLGRLFEIVISKKSEYIMIAEEIEYLKSYLHLMSVRYNHSFAVDFEIDQEILSLYTLKFILQPIVENAIIHGLGDLMIDGEIHISGKRIDDKVLFTISDNGKGMSPETVDKLLKAEHNSDKGRFSSLGIMSVNERIRLNFGDGYGIKIESNEGAGTKVTVTIQAITVIPEKEG